MRAVLVLLLLASLPAAPAIAQKETGTAPPAQPGSPSSSGGTRRTRLPGLVAIGERAPDFELDASNERPLKLSRTRGDWVLLVFGDRKEEMLALVNIHTPLRKLGVQILPVCNEKAHNLRSYVAREKVPFLMLADVTGEVSAMYGVYDYLTQTTQPGFVVIDRDGIVRMSVLGQRPPADQVRDLVEFIITSNTGVAPEP